MKMERKSIILTIIKSIILTIIQITGVILIGIILLQLVRIALYHSEPTTQISASILCIAFSNLFIYILKESGYKYI